MDQQFTGPEPLTNFSPVVVGTKLSGDPPFSVCIALEGWRRGTKVDVVIVKP